MNFFKHQDLDSGWWGLLEGTNIENATIIKVSDGTQPLLSPYPNQIEMIIDDLERFGEMNIDSGVLEVPQGCLYNIYSLSFHLDELKTSIEQSKFPFIYFKFIRASYNMLYFMLL